MISKNDDALRSRIRMLTPLGRRSVAERRRLRRGVYLLPSMFTMGSMFCGYACIVYAMRGEFATAAPFIGFAIVVDMLDGRIARMTGTTSAFGVEFDSLADIISFGVAPAILAFAWGLQPLGRLGWAAGFLFVAAAAVRLARFNIQAGSTDKRYFVGMPSPAAAGIPAATVYAYPAGFQGFGEALPGTGHGHRPGPAHGQHGPLPEFQEPRPKGATEVSRAAAVRAWPRAAGSPYRARTRCVGLQLPRRHVRGTGLESSASTTGERRSQDRTGPGHDRRVWADWALETAFRSA